MNHTREAAREKWQQIIKAQQASGQTVAAYCRDHGLGQASFFAWKRRLQGAAPAAEFVEVKAVAGVDPVSADGIEVCLGGGRRLLVRPGFDRDLFAELIGVLEGLT
jgi:hypothetical protein